ncbi:MAG: PQQ-dependent sugar dehydrogenase, partial [Bacteroidia bacterium]|nr:PQQ-dependent sugar dehydrogenase [Bacteroidia bacterium]
MKLSFLILLFSAISFCSIAQTQITLTQIASGLNKPVGIENCGDDRLFIVEQNGYIEILDPITGNLNPQPFLDIDAKVGSSGNEQGLLGLAFHPNYKQNGYFFVNYTNNSGNTVIARYSVSVTDSNQANPNSEQILLTITQPYSNHNGGQIVFGPDGYLYIGMGDGGSAGDPQNFAQNPNSRLGKMLRIDVDNGNPYAIPPDNPFIGVSGYLPEIWSIGLRNPWRFSYDFLEENWWISDVGQNAIEEINLEPVGVSGRNYGWRCYEGTTQYNFSNCSAQTVFTTPIHQYTHSTQNGCSVTGGYVYRGGRFNSLWGKYIYCDYCSGRFWSIERGSAPNTWVN